MASFVRTATLALRRAGMTGTRVVTFTQRGYSCTPAARAGPLHGHALGYVPIAANVAAGGGSGMHATTILAVRKDGVVAVIGDGQVTRGSEVVKSNARKIRRLGEGVISGFAGSTADCLTLRERLEAKLEAHPGQLARACVELAKEWRTEKYLRNLEAVMLVVDKDVSLTITGAGDVIEPQDGIIAIGSGGPYALAAARALLDSPLDAMSIAEKSMKIAADMCVYTNSNFVRDSLTTTPTATPTATPEGSTPTQSGGAPLPPPTVDQLS